MIETMLESSMNINNSKADKYCSILLLVDFVHTNLDQSRERLHSATQFSENHGCLSQLGWLYLLLLITCRTNYQLGSSQSCLGSTGNMHQVAAFRVLKERLIWIIMIWSVGSDSLRKEVQLLMNPKMFKVISTFTTQDHWQRLRCSTELLMAEELTRTLLASSKLREWERIRMISSGKLVRFMVLRTLHSSAMKTSRQPMATQ